MELLMSEQFLRTARGLVARGFAIIPVSGDNQPLVALEGATGFDGALQAFAKRFPSARIGTVVDGQLADVFDPRHPEQGLRKNEPSYHPRRSCAPHPGLEITRMSDVAPQPVSWLWQGRIPFGMISLHDGDPGIGKSTLWLDFAARLSRGDVMPDGSPGPAAAGTVILSAEDDLSRVTIPRLQAAGADLGRIATVGLVDRGLRRPPVIRADDLKKIEEAIIEVGAKLLIVDPLVAYLPGDVNANHDQGVRRALSELRDLAERTGIAIVVIRHLKKSPTSNALYRGGGSIGIIGAARAAMVAGRDPDDPTGMRRILAWTKMNVGPLPGSYAYRIDASPGQTHPRVVWDGPSDCSADELLAVDSEARSSARLEEAKQFLRDKIAGTEVPAREVKRDAKRAGISNATLRRAQVRLQINRRKTGRPGETQVWLWSLPDAGRPAGERLHGDDEHLQVSPDRNSLCERKDAEDAHASRNGHLQTPNAPNSGSNPSDGDAPGTGATKCPYCGGTTLGWAFGSVCTTCRRRCDAPSDREGGQGSASGSPGPAPRPPVVDDDPLRGT
jgi:hypothetical protein